MTGSRMQTLAIIILASSSVVVVAFDLRELFIAWYSETSPRLTVTNWTTALVQMLLCLTISITMFARLALTR
jgi:hypothetical protein